MEEIFILFFQIFFWLSCAQKKIKKSDKQSKCGD
jgi:hypothetical protein